MARKKASAIAAAKKAGKKRPQRQPNRFRFQSFKSQLRELSIEAIRKVGGWKGAVLPADNSSWFEEALMDWKELNCTSHFAKFCVAIEPYCGNLPQIVFHQAEIKKILLEHISVPSSLAVQPLAMLTAMLAKDLATDFDVEYFQDVLLAFVEILKVNETMEDIESVMRTIFYVSRVLERQLVASLVDTFRNLFKPALLKASKPFIRQMIIELWATLGRKILLNSEIIQEISSFGSASESRLLVASQLLAVVCFDGKNVNKFLPKHMRTIIELLLNQMQMSLLESVIAQVNNISTAIAENQEKIAPTIAESLLSLQDPSCLVNIASNILSRSDVSIALNLLERAINEPITIELAAKVSDILLKILTSREADLQFVLKHRSSILALFNINIGCTLKCLNELISKRPSLVSPLFSANNLEKICITAFESHPLESLQLMNLCKDQNSSQYPSRFSVDLDSIIHNSMNAELVVLALKLTETHFSPLQMISLIDRMTGMRSANTISLEILDAWKFSGKEKMGHSELIEMISDWTGYRSVLILAKKLMVEKETSLFTLAKRGLLSGDSLIRTASLELFAGLEEDSKVLPLCLKLENSSAWNYSCDREKGIHLGAMFHQIGHVSQEDVEIIIRQLMGIIAGGFKPIQVETGRVLTAYAGKFGLLFRQVFADLLFLFDRHSGSSIDSSTDKMYGPFALSSIFEFLAKYPTSMDYVQNDIITLLLSIFYEQKTTAYSEGLIGLVQKSLGPCFTALSGLKNLSKNEKATELKNLLLSNFLSFGDAAIQRKALDVYYASSIDLSELNLWKESLCAILESEQAMREKLVELTSQSHQGQVTLNGDILPVMIRILYGRMIAKKGTGAGRSSPKTRRKLVLNYVAAWNAEAIGEFVGFLPKHNLLGYLNLIESVLEKLARFMPSNVFLRVVEQLVDLSLSDDKAVKRLALQRIHQLWTITLGGHQVNSEMESALMAHHSRFYEGVIAPRLVKFEEELGQSGSSLFDLVLLWSGHRPSLILNNLGSLSSAIGADPSKVKSSILSQLTTLWTNICNSAESSETITQSIKMVIAPLMQAIAKRLTHLLANEADQDAKLAFKLVSLLVKLANFVDDSQYEAAQVLSTILLEGGFMSKKKYFRMESLHTVILQTLSRLLPITNVDAFKTVAGWFSLPTVRGHKARKALCSLFQIVTAKMDQRQQTLAKCISEMNAYEFGTSVDPEPDFERRSAGFNQLRSLCLNVSPNEINWWLPILSMSMAGMQDAEELGVRNQSAFLLESYLERCKETGLDEESWNLLVIGQLWQGIRSGIKFSKSEAVRSGLMGLLGKLVATFVEKQPFTPLGSLLAWSDEADVFENLGGLAQVHRRVRAIRRLGQWAQQETSQIDRKVIDDILLPYLRPWTIPNPQAAPIDALVQAESISTTAILIGKLSVKSGLTRLRLLLKRLQKSVSEDQAAMKKKSSSTSRVLLKLIISIVGTIIPGMEKDVKGELLELLFEAALGPSLARTCGLQLCEAIGSVLVLDETDDEVRMKHLPKLMSSLCQGLRDKEQDAREASRSALSKLMGKLGSSYLAYALNEMSSVLLPSGHQKKLATRGSSFIASNTLFNHVHGYTAAKLTIQMNPSELSQAAFDELLHISMKHGFGRLALEKSKGSAALSGQEWTGRALEAKTQLSYDLLSLLVKITPTRIDRVLEALAETVQANPNEPEPIEAAFKSLESALPVELPLLYDLVSASQPQTIPDIHGYRFALLGLNVLLNHLKRVESPEQVGPMLDGFLKPLVKVHLAPTNRHLQLTIGSIQCLNVLVGRFVSWLPSISEHQTFIISRLFELLVKTDAKKNASSVSHILKLISTMVRNVPDASLTDSQTKALLSYTREHLASSTDGKSSLAFSLVKALLHRRVLVVELVELMKTIQEHLLISPDASVRSQCRTVFLQYLVEYPLGEEKLKEHISWAIKNMGGFEWDTGRQSAMFLLSSLMTKLPDQVILDWSSMIILTVASRISPQVETSSVCQAALSQLLSALVGRIGGSPALKVALKEATSLIRKWIGTDKPSVVKAAWMLAPAFIGYDQELIQFLTSQAESYLAEDPTLALSFLVNLESLPQSTVDCLLNDKVLLYASLEVRSLVIKILMKSPSVIVENRAKLASIWSRSLLELPQETEKEAIDALAKALLMTKPSPDNLRFILKRVKLILADATLIGTNRATLSAAIRLIAGLLVVSLNDLSDDADTKDERIDLVLAMAIHISSCDLIQPNQTTSVDRSLADDLRTGAQQILELAQNSLGSDVYAHRLQAVLKSQAISRASRKAATSQLAVNNPEAYAQRKLARNSAKKEQRKRKVDRTRERAQKRQRPSTNNS